MQPKAFRYTLIVPSLPNPIVLIHAPKGWDENSVISFQRSADYFGAIRSLTIPLDFTFEGAKILRGLFYQYNAQAIAYLQIEKLKPETYEYDIAYYGKIDFSKAEDTDNTFSVNATEADLSVKIKAFESTKFDISLDVPEAITVTLNPLKLIESADFIFTPSQTDQQPGYTALTLVNNEIKSVTTSVKDVGYRTEPSPNFSTDGDWFYKAATNTSITLNLSNVQGSVQRGIVGGDRRFRLQLVKQDGTILKTYFDITSSGPGGYPFNFSDTSTYNLNTNDRLYLYQRLDGSASSDVGFNWTDGDMNLSYTTESPATTCKALRGLDLYKAIIKQINGGNDYPVQSFLLQEWKDLVFTSGDAIRQLEGAKIKTSHQDFFKSVSAVTCAGHAVENGKATIEYRSSFYRNSKTLSMNDSKEVQINTALDLMFNTIKGGYKDNTYDEVNGKDEVNSQVNWVIDVFQPQKELDISSEYRADPYGAEFARINLDGKKTTDANSDNDVWMFYTITVGELVTPITGNTAGVNISGVLAGSSYYNWIISPSQNLRRWGSFIRSVFFGNEGYQIRFASALKNSNMVVTGDQAIVENANIPLSELEKGYFMPYYANFKTKLPNNLWEFISSGIYGYGSFVFEGVELNGFFIEFSDDLAKNSEREPKLLLTTDNNLLELIR